MVGAPKHLHDLAKIEADVRITCKRCRFEEDWTREDLAKHLHAIGGSTVWSEITRHMRCRKARCGSGDLRALPVPYARRAANTPRRISKLDAELVQAALTVLEQAVVRAPKQTVATIEVRVALLVTYVYSRNRDATRLFWDRAGDVTRTVDAGLGGPLAMIRHSLVERGWIAPAVLLERQQVWPWSSPAPPGWLAGPGNPRPPANDGEG